MSKLPKVGAFVLETLTTGMYTNPLDAVREFVQNATDSILQAQDPLISRHAGRIEIQIEPDSRRFTVRDNGIGISQVDVFSRLIDIGVSEKDLATSAGFRGIGRLAGIAYCRILSFRTSAKNERVVSTVEIDCEGLRRSILPAMRQVEELSDVMARNSKVMQEKCTTDEHFFEVVMEGIVDAAAPSFLDWQILEAYLSQVAPVGFDAQRFMFAPKILEWVEHSDISVPTVTLVIKTPDIEREVFKPYKTHYKTQNSRGGRYDFYIKDIEFYPEYVTPDSPYWLWYGKTDLLGTIKDERSAGLRFRAKNIAIGGPERVAELFAETAKTNGRFNAWHIGEIHILSSRAIPNARRDGFEDVGDWPEIAEGLKPFIKERVEEIRQRSHARNRPTAKVMRAAQIAIDEANDRLQVGFASEQQRSALLERVKKEQVRTEEAAKVRQRPADAVQLEEVAQQLEAACRSLEQESKYAVKNLRSNLDRKQRKVVIEILQILYQTLDDESYRKAEAAILARFQVQDGGIGK
ncbi:MAG: ATP-binding protein [Anaerolineae bacterium]|nr:ATP-binding protein [Anaerolineae bacterium]